MFKKTLIAAAVVGVAALGAANTADAREGHKHNGEYAAKKHYGLQNTNIKGIVTVKYDDRKGRGKYGKHNRHNGHKGRGVKKGGFPPFVIRNTLNMRGYRKIKFTDRQLPVYVVKACKRGHRFKIGLNRWGKILWKQPRGFCGRRFY